MNDNYEEEFIDAAEVLRGIGCRVTQGRVALIEFLAEAKKPMMPKEILENLYEVFDQATLYRALETLTDAGILRKLHLREDESYYYEFAREHHHHIVCIKCGHVEDFSESACDAIMKSALKHSSEFARLDAHTLELSGICKTCI